METIQVLVFSIIISVIFVSAFILGSYFGNRKQIIYIQENQKMFKIDESDIPTEEEVYKELQKFSMKKIEDEPAWFPTNEDEKKAENTKQFLKELSEINTD